MLGCEGVDVSQGGGETSRHYRLSYSLHCPESGGFSELSCGCNKAANLCSIRTHTQMIVHVHVDKLTSYIKRICKCTWVKRQVQLSHVYNLGTQKQILHVTLSQLKAKHFA